MIVLRSLRYRCLIVVESELWLSSRKKATWICTFWLIFRTDSLLRFENASERQNSLVIETVYGRMFLLLQLAALSTLVCIYGPSKMHFLRYSPIRLVSRYRRNSGMPLRISHWSKHRWDALLKQLPFILLCIWLSCGGV
ncbi:hypothetical protein Tco_1426822 [Tanacetum coccineum]